MPNSEPPVFDYSSEAPPMELASSLANVAEQTADFARQTLMAVDAAIHKRPPAAENEVIKILAAQKDNEATYSARYPEDRVAWNVANLGILGMRTANDGTPAILPDYLHLRLPPQAHKVVDEEGRLTAQARSAVRAQYQANWKIDVTEVGKKPKPGDVIDLNKIETEQRRDIARAAVQGWNDEAAHIAAVREAKIAQATHDKLVAQERAKLSELAPNPADYNSIDCFMATRAHVNETMKVVHDHLVHNPLYRDMEDWQKRELFKMYAHNGGEFHNITDWNKLIEHGIPLRLVLNEDQVNTPPTRIESSRMHALKEQIGNRRDIEVKKGRWLKPRNQVLSDAKKNARRSNSYTLRPGGGRSPGRH